MDPRYKWLMQISLFWIENKGRIYTVYFALYTVCLHEGEKDNNAYNTKGGRKSVVPDEAEILYVQLVLYFLQATSEGNTIIEKIYEKKTWQLFSGAWHFYEKVKNAI